MTSFDQRGAADRSSGSNVDAAKQQAADTAQAGKQAAGAVASTATDQAKNVAQETKDQARDLFGKTKSELSEQVGTQQGAVVENLRSLGDQLAEMTDDVHEQGTAIDLATQARDRVRSAADWLDGRDPGEVLDELRTLGRNRPGAFLLGAALAGVAAGRLTRGVVAVHTDDSAPGTTPAHRADDADLRPRPAVSGTPDAGHAHGNGVTVPGYGGTARP